MTRPPLPPSTAETALATVRVAGAARDTRDPDRVALAHTEDSGWRDRDEPGESDAAGFLRRREASVDDVAIAPPERRVTRPRGEAEAAPPLR